MYNIIQLNDKNLSELQVIAKELGIKKADSYKKEDLVYKILDEQAIVGATKKVAADKLKEERKNEEQKKKRSRVAPTKKEDKVVSATKSEEANKTKETAPVKAAPQPSKKEESTNKEKETVVVEAKAENTLFSFLVGATRERFFFCSSFLRASFSLSAATFFVAPTMACSSSIL